MSLLLGFSKPNRKLSTMVVTGQKALSICTKETAAEVGGKMLDGV
jgi:hypothetical protein